MLLFLIMIISNIYASNYSIILGPHNYSNDSLLDKGNLSLAPYIIDCSLYPTLQTTIIKTLSSNQWWQTSFEPKASQDLRSLINPPIPIPVNTTQKNPLYISHEQGILFIINLELQKYIKYLRLITDNHTALIRNNQPLDTATQTIRVNDIKYSLQKNHLKYFEKKYCNFSSATIKKITDLINQDNANLNIINQPLINPDTIIEKLKIHFSELEIIFAEETNNKSSTFFNILKEYLSKNHKNLYLLAILFALSIRRPQCINFITMPWIKKSPLRI